MTPTRDPTGGEGPAEAAFAVLVREHSGAVLGFVRRRVRNPELAEDLVQETFLRAWKSKDSYRGDASQRGWLYAIAANVVRDWARRRGRRFEEVPLPEHVDLPAPASDPAGDVVATEAAARLTSTLRELPANQREMFLLRERDGLSYREIADVLSCPVGTVMSGLARAREKLLRAVEGR